MNDVADIRCLRTPCSAADTQYSLEFDPEFGTLWAWMQPKGNPCFSLTLLNDIRAQDERLEASGGSISQGTQSHSVSYYVFGSRIKGVFNFGGDLALFLLLIKSREREALEYYARRCIDALFPKIQNFYCPTLTTISLVQGDALGGGFEAALSSDLVVAEESAVMGMPEILFNLFPGMGAFSLLARRIGAQSAERLIASGQAMNAQELRDLGIVDIVAPDGQGESVTYEWIKRNHKRRNGLQGMYAARQRVFPITRAELDSITQVWVDAALRLSDRDLKMMRRIVSAQLKRMDGAGATLPTVSQIDAEEAAMEA